ncbi:phage tail protein I [Dapis sp. BLCC M229]|uniref:phage tail protein I n=1 Tax=Dapis sp. BLCC M229 TaxID=3400188 RepID=UPI003CFAC9C3
MNKEQLISTYQEYLPAILQEQVFLGRFLLAFEKILSGLDQTPSPEKIITANNENVLGLEEILNRIHLYFNPQETPQEFLPWLAGWVALSLRDDWSVDVKRALILKVVELYRWRGTKKGLSELLQIYLTNSNLGSNVEVFDNFTNFPHYFQVQLTLNDRDPVKYWQQAKIAKAIIDREKPAQTYYALKILVLTMQLTKRPQESQFSENFDLPEAALTQETEKIELEAIVEVTKPNPVTENVLNKIKVRFKDDVSNFHLLTPETTIEDHKITIKRILYNNNFYETINQLTVTIKNLNNVEINGKIRVKVSFAGHEEDLLNTNLKLGAVPLQNILQICYNYEIGKELTRETIPTILGTTTQL